jgi:DNA-binding protein YbaB
MFDKFKAMGAMAGLLKNQDGIKAAGERIKAKAQETIVTGTAGGGAVRATVRGDMYVLGFQIEPALAAGMAAEEKTRRLAESLLTDAVNDGMRQARVIMQEAINKEARAMGLPDLGGPGGLAGLLS